MRRISSLCLPVADQVASSLLRSSLRSRVHRARRRPAGAQPHWNAPCPEPPPVGAPSSPALRSEHSLQRCWLAFEPQPRHKEAFAQRGRPDSATVPDSAHAISGRRTDPETPTKPPNARPLGRREFDEPPLLIHHDHPTKRHPDPSDLTIGNVSTMFPNGCPECPWSRYSARLRPRPKRRFAGPGTPAFRPESRR